MVNPLGDEGTPRQRFARRRQSLMKRPTMLQQGAVTDRRSPLRNRSRRMFIDVPDESVAGDKVTTWYEQQRAAWGYLPNYAAAFATRPEVAQAWNSLIKAVGKGMERRRFELATIAAARA